jgi:hypothetical protein
LGQGIERTGKNWQVLRRGLEGRFDRCLVPDRSAATFAPGLQFISRAA